MQLGGVRCPVPVRVSVIVRSVPCERVDIIDRIDGNLVKSLSYARE